MMRPNPWLIAGGILSLAASLLHIGIILGGPGWYRFFGAGEYMARAAERGSAEPAIVAAAIASVLAIWALYAFSGAGFIRRLPLLRTGLVIIASIYLLRAAAALPIFAFRPAAANAFLAWSSLIVLVYGLCYAVGTWIAWPGLSNAGLKSGRSPAPPA